MNKNQLVCALEVVQLALVAIEQSGGFAYLVGGVVRDLVMNQPINDIDIEVHGLLPEQLEKALKQVGPLFYVGKKFGVYRIASIDIDWSLPRTDSIGRKPLVQIDPFLGIKNACRRRDVTMNAMAILLSSDESSLYGLADYQIIDPFNGLDAIEKKVIRLIDPELFVQDPLRFYRVMHFASRFNFDPDEQLSLLAKGMILYDQINNEPLSAERIQAELRKMLIKGVLPSKGIRWVVSLARMKELFPALLSWHNTSDDLLHSQSQFDRAMNAIDYAATLSRKPLNQENQEISMPEENESYYAFILAILAAFLVEKEFWHGSLKELRQRISLLLSQFASKKETFSSIALLLSGASMFHKRATCQANDQSYELKKLATFISPTWSLYQLFVFIEILEFDDAEKELKYFDYWRNQALLAGVLLHKEPALLHGADFISEGFIGAEIGKALEFAYELQIKQGIQDPIFLKQQLLNYFFLKK